MPIASAIGVPASAMVRALPRQVVLPYGVRERGRLGGAVGPVAGERGVQVGQVLHTLVE
ncbi:hypothetical protein [Streptomyces avermitilis]|uniref:hypothetical protein n=1 Tax=Streptomyces avermitilis TaxID=33903 RepID=UPI0033BB4DA6